MRRIDALLGTACTAALASAPHAMVVDLCTIVGVHAALRRIKRREDALGWVVRFVLTVCGVTACDRALASLKNAPQRLLFHVPRTVFMAQKWSMLLYIVGAPVVSYALRRMQQILPQQHVLDEAQLDCLCPLRCASFPVGDNVTDQHCAICTEEFSTKELHRVLVCGHAFHAHCVDPWLLSRSSTCPLCRMDISAAATYGGV